MGSGLGMVGAGNGRDSRAGITAGIVGKAGIGVMVGVRAGIML